VRARLPAWLALAALAAALTPATGHADSPDPAYAALPAPVYEVYGALLSYADDSAFDRLGASLKHLRELFRALDGCCAEPLESRMTEAVSRRDAAQARERVLEMIAVDFRRHLDAAASATDAPRASQELQMAAVLYAILSPVVRHADGARDERIRGELKGLLHLDRSPELATRSQVVLADLGGAVRVCPARSVGR
jgi:hypothetical protein